jgi:sulfite exporter TauE/SafE
LTYETESAALGLGFMLGLRHALDADHIAAVSTIVSESRSIWRSSLAGTSWGLGHTAALLAAGTAIIGLKVTIPPGLAHSIETIVAIMLILLGSRAVHTALPGWTIHRHPHSHDSHTHIHVHVHVPGGDNAHQHGHLLAFGARPFLVGLVHGLAGSAGLMVLVLSTITSVFAGFAYIVVFGLGSTTAMFLMSGLISLPFVWTASRFRSWVQVLQLIVGVGSILFGCVYAVAH